MKRHLISLGLCFAVAGCNLKDHSEAVASQTAPAVAHEYVIQPGTPFIIDGNPVAAYGQDPCPNSNEAECVAIGTTATQVHLTAVSMRNGDALDETWLVDRQGSKKLTFRRPSGQQVVAVSFADLDL